MHQHSPITSQIIKRNNEKVEEWGVYNHKREKKELKRLTII